jgi:hypothetical protein
MDKVFVVKRVAEKVASTEAAIDASIEETAGLMSGIIEARRDLQVSHIVVDPAVTKVAAAMNALAEARQAMIEAHHALYEVQLRLGVRRTTMEGGVWSIDADHKPAESLAPLSRAS